MNKRKTSFLAIIIVFIILVTGCSGPQASQKTLFIEKKSAGEKKPEQKHIGITPAIEEDIEEILTVSSAEALCGYPIDENFLLWFYQKYGENILKKMADNVRIHPKEEESWYRLTGNTLHVLWLYYVRDLGIYGKDLEQVYFKDSLNSTDIVLDFAGDLVLDQERESFAYIGKDGKNFKNCISKELLHETKSADIFMINNEGTYVTGGTPLEGKAYTFQSHPKNAQVLKIMGTDITSLANNHAFDYGEEGLLETMDTFHKMRLPFVGAGKNLEDAKKPVYFVINGKKIAFVSATQIERTLNYTKEAGIQTPGVLKTLHPEFFLESIREAKKKSDFVVAFVHWGTEGEENFEPDQTSLGKQYIDAGADAVIGGHTHCLQGIEFYKGNPIFYSLGNFWFDWDEPNAEKTAVVQITLHSDNTAEYKILPCLYSKFKTSLVTDAKENRILLDYVESISNGISIDGDGTVLNTR